MYAVPEAALAGGDATAMVYRPDLIVVSVVDSLLLLLCRFLFQQFLAIYGFFLKIQSSSDFVISIFFLGC